MSETLVRGYATPQVHTFAISVLAQKAPQLDSSGDSRYFGTDFVARVVSDVDQEWFWKTEWQAGEIEADRQAEAGEGVRYESMDDFLNDLP